MSQPLLFADAVAEPHPTAHAEAKPEGDTAAYADVTPLQAVLVLVGGVSPLAGGFVDASTSVVPSVGGFAACSGAGEIALHATAA